MLQKCLPVCGLLFIAFTMPFNEQKFLNWVKQILSAFFLYSLHFWCLRYEIFDQFNFTKIDPCWVQIILFPRFGEVLHQYGCTCGRELIWMTTWCITESSNGLNLGINHFKIIFSNSCTSFLWLIGWMVWENSRMLESRILNFNVGHIHSQCPLTKCDGGLLGWIFPCLLF